MEYSNSYGGDFSNETVRIPSTFDHLTQVLYHIKDEDWAHFQRGAAEALAGKVVFPRKIKPSSLRKIRDSRAAELIIPLIDEEMAHRDPNSEAHRGGGIFHAIQSLFQVVGGWIGGKKVNSFVGGAVENKALTPYQRTMAKLVQGTYKQKRPENIGKWTRIDDLDTRYGSFWVNPAGEYTLSVRGTKLNFRDIFKDIKIAFGSKEQSDNDLTESLRKFHQIHPDSKLSVAGHSLGTMLATNSLKSVDLPGPRDLYLFNPASSPFQAKSAVRDIQDQPDWNTKYFLNRSDIVSNYFSQQLSQEEIEDHVSYGQFARSPLAAHGLAQWVESF